MNGDLTHASFFSGVGGTDLGLERAGWRTVSFSEIDPYACAVLAERWPDVPNYGSIVALARGSGADATSGRAERRIGERDVYGSADLWSGGFPCQDLSVAGKRRGFGLRTPSKTGRTETGVRSGDASGPAFDTATRSGLAFAFLDLVERHRPPAVLLENVPGLLSSHRGRDMAQLLGRLAELGYGVAYRVLDAQHFGVPQRRRRVFILGLRCGPDDASGRAAAIRAAEVLSVGTRCGRHPATGHEAGPGVADGAERGVIGTVPAALGHHGHHGYTLGQEALSDGFLQLSPPPHTNGMRAPDGLAGRPHDRGGVAFGISQFANYREGRVTLRAQGGDLGGGSEALVASTLGANAHGGGWSPEPGEHIIKADAMSDDPLLPLGLDSHRYRCCGNGVVAPVAEWLGLRLKEALA